MRAISFLTVAAILTAIAWPVYAQDHAQPLAQDHVIVYEVRTLPDPGQWICVGSPDIIQLPSGRLVASMELWLKLPDEGREGGIDYPNHCKIKASDDNGKTWAEIGTNGITWGSLFWVNGALYLIGNDPLDRSIRITRSRDEGATWEKAFSGPPSNERRIAMLQYSYDGLNWFQAGCVAMSKNPLESFHYTAQVAAGDHLLVLSRTSVGGAPYSSEREGWRHKESKQGLGARL